MIRKVKQLLFLTVVLEALLMFAPSLAAADGDCSIADAAIQYASKIRGLKNKKKVPCRLQDKSEVEQYLRSAIKEKAPADRLEHEAWSYRLLGVIPWDYNYTEGLVKMYTEQLGGYYDSEKEYYAMAAWMPAIMQAPIAVHELTHALQDQNYDLDKLIDEKRDTSDTMMSRSALVEGDATAVMLDYTKLLSGPRPLKDDPSVSAIMMQNIAGTMMTNAMQQAPGTLQAMLIFPYISGLNFVHALLKSGGYPAVDGSYMRPTHTTSEILHPDRYAANSFKFKNPPPPLEKLGGKSADKELYSDSLGEFVLSTWLSSWLGPVESSRVASGWAGDRLWLIQGADSKKRLRLSTVWSDEAAAAKFAEAVKTAMTKRLGRGPSGAGESMVWIGKNPSMISVGLDGDGVMISITE